MAWVSSVPRVRLLVSPGGAVAYIVAAGSIACARPRVWPASCVMVFWTSMRTQPVSLGVVQAGPSLAVKTSLLPLASAASLNSVSVSVIWPVKRLEVVVVVAITPAPWSQQS